MTPEQIEAIARQIAPKPFDQYPGPFLDFALAIIAQARAEFRAELKPVAYLMQQDIDELRKTGRHAAVIYSESISPLDVPLAIIPDTKE